MFKKLLIVLVSLINKCFQVVFLIAVFRFTSGLLFLSLSCFLVWPLSSCISARICAWLQKEGFGPQNWSSCGGCVCLGSVWFGALPSFFGIAWRERLTPGCHRARVHSSHFGHLVPAGWLLIAFQWHACECLRFCAFLKWIKPLFTRRKYNFYYNAT